MFWPGEGPAHFCKAVDSKHGQYFFSESISGSILFKYKMKASELGL